MPTHKKGQDRDKYYQLAKDQGYRSRAAFKLIQINKRYDFLRKAKVCIDLCAAPGGWSQVAAKFMPAGSLVIGVDLLPIKALRGIKTIVGDITTASCRKAIVAELQGWKADVVLCDGAPNIGASYNKDAIVQNELVLAALKTATDHLNKGGVFCTKVYRSVDYNALVWVLQQVFEDVQTMKPNSSRSQSSEIFLVCLGYTAPKTIDARLFDVNHVFKEVADPGLQRPDVLHKKYDSSHKRHRTGYDDDHGLLLTAKCNVTDFIASKEAVRLLTDIHEINFDTEECQKYKTHPKTTEDVKIALSDLRVLGKIDFKKLLKWRQLMRDTFHATEATESIVPKSVTDKTEEEEELDPEQTIQEEIRKMRADAEHARRKENKKKRKEMAKERLRQQLGMDNNAFEVEDDRELFHLDTAMTLADADRLADVNLSDDEDFAAAMAASDTEDEDDIRNKMLIELPAADMENELEGDYLQFLDKRRKKRAISVGQEMAEELESEERTMSSKKTMRMLDPEAQLKAKARQDSNMNGDLSGDESENEQVRQMRIRQERSQRAMRDDLQQYLDMLSGKAPKKAAKEGEEAPAQSESDSSSDDDDDDEEHEEDIEDDSDLDSELEAEIAAAEAAKKSAGKKMVTRGADSLDVRTNQFFSNPVFGSSMLEADEEDIPEVPVKKVSRKRKAEDSEEEFDFMPKTDKDIRKEKRKKDVERNERKRMKNAVNVDDDDEVYLGDSSEQKPFEASSKKPVKKAPSAMSATADFEIVPQQVVKEEDALSLAARLPKRVDDRSYDSDNEEYDSHDRLMTMALGTYMLRSSRKKALVDASYNRFSWNDPSALPSWFLDDELRHNKPQVPVPPALLEQLKNKYQLTGTKVIKKVAEARARKKKRALTKLKAAKKQATVLAENPELSEKQKVRAITKAMRGSKMNDKRPSKVYVTTKKTKAGSVGAASGGKGKLKFVDKRMKKETRAMKSLNKRGGKRK